MFRSSKRSRGEGNSRGEDSSRGGGSERSSPQVNRHMEVDEEEPDLTPITGFESIVFVDPEHRIRMINLLGKPINATRFVHARTLRQLGIGQQVKAVLRGNALGVRPHSNWVSQDGELFDVDCVTSNIVEVTPPLSQCEAGWGSRMFAVDQTNCLR